VLGCIGRNEAYAVPRSWIHSKLKFLNTTEMKDETYWHLYLNILTLMVRAALR